MNTLNDSLAVSMQLGALNAAKKYIADGADVQFDDNKPLHLAVKYNQIAAVDFLLEHGADLDACESLALRIAARNQLHRMTQHLIECGANTDKVLCDTGESDATLECIHTAIEDIAYDEEITRVSPSA